LANHTIARTTHFAMHRSAPDAATAVMAAAQPVGLGAMVPKRWAKRAVTRNLIKRQIYSLGDGMQGQLLPVNHVIRLRATFDRKQFKSASSELLKAAVRHELEQLFSKAVAPAAKGLA
jgi:ribonuclease P protein component